MECWYFAYGSNLCIDQMAARIGARSQSGGVRIARLPNHRLLFQQLAAAGPAFANIQAPGPGVLGVAYRCTAACLAKLDRYEDGYERRPIRIVDQHGQELDAVTYVMPPGFAAHAVPPIAIYLATIVSGARRHGLPEDYIETIVAAAGSEILRKHSP